MTDATRRARHISLAASGGFVTIVAATAVLIYIVVSRLIDAGMANTPTAREHLNVLGAILAIEFALFSLAAMTAQIRLAYLQIAQIDEQQRRDGRQRDDSALVSALQELTKQLQRRPTPIETVNFSLFGAKHE